jgi:hypothetical protein
MDIGREDPPREPHSPAALATVLGLILLGMLAAPLWLLYLGSGAGSGVSIAMSIGVPLLVGFGLGWALHSWHLIPLNTIVAVSCGTVSFLVMLTGFDGPCCAVVYAAAALLPAWFGAYVGHLAGEQRAKRGAGSGMPPSVLVPWLLLPGAIEVAERALRAAPAEETLTVSRLLDAPAAEAFACRILDPSDTTPPSGWFRLRVARPVAAEGRASALDDVKVCKLWHGTTGTLALRVASVVQGRELALDVVAQDNVEDRALAMRRVTLRCEPAGAAQTLATLEVRFEPKMFPRWYWRPFESFVGGITLDATLAAWAGACARRAAPK